MKEGQELCRYEVLDVRGEIKIKKITGKIVKKAGVGFILYRVKSGTTTYKLCEKDLLNSPWATTEKKALEKISKNLSDTKKMTHYSSEYYWLVQAKLSAVNLKLERMKFTRAQNNYFSDGRTW